MKCFVKWVFEIFFVLFVVVSGSVSYTDAVNQYTSIGCFDLNYALRMNYHRHMPDVNFEKCTTYCVTRRSKYAGIERSDSFCYCGGDLAEESVKRNDSLCNVVCPDELSQKCGGDWLMSVYDVSGERGTGPRQEEDIGFLVGISTGVIWYNTSNMNVFDTIMTMADWAVSVNYHFKKNIAFAFAKSKIQKSTLDAKLPLASGSPELVREVTGCDGFAVDWEQDMIYWANCSNTSTIMAMDFNGNNLTTIFNRPGESVHVRKMEIDPYQKMLFWVADGVVESCKLTGGNFKTNMSAPGVVVRAITLDTTTRRIYYAGNSNQSSTLNSMDYSGSDNQELFALPAFRSVYGMGVFRRQLYWINYANSRDVLYRAPLNLTSTSEVVVLKTVDRAVWHMKLVHPDLQSRPPRDLCLDKGCSHSCITTSNKPSCSCPEGLQLDSDEQTCIGPTNDKQVREGSLSSRTIALCVFLVGATILISIGLLYIGDHYWPTVRARFSTVPYKREDSSINPQYDTTDDDVNLIIS